MSRFAFAFEERYRVVLRLFGVREERSYVEVDDRLFLARFGPWSMRTPLTNIGGTQVGGPYRAHRAIGIRASLKDFGLTFGSTTAGGVCVLFRERVWMKPVGAFPHAGLTVTVADREGLVEALRPFTGV